MILASKFKRFLALQVDGLILSAPLFVMPDFTFFSIAIVSLYCVLYFGFFESSRYKATPGKKLFRLYVYTTDGKKLTLLRAVARYLLYMVPSLPIQLVAGYAIYKSASDHALFAIENAALVIGLYAVAIVLNLIWFLPIFFTKKRQGVHELLTSTVVCKKTA